MEIIQDTIHLQYQGYANTPLFWDESSEIGLKQFKIHSQQASKPKLEIDKKMRLGFRVERFVGWDLAHTPGIEILAENIQIQNKNQTIGELDCLLLDHGKPVHLEIVYKLYLYDNSIGNSEIDYWIGGNRRDSFAKRLKKLKSKQLPLLHNSFTKPILDKLNLSPETIEQRVHFRAQLYVPYNSNPDFKLINKNCLKGFYIRPKELNLFSKHVFYIPNRYDWLIEPQATVNWIAFKDFKSEIHRRMQHKSYPLCWIKFPDGSMIKFFVVWWD